MNKLDRQLIFKTLSEARDAADKKWGQDSLRYQNIDPHKRVTILLEEVGEVARAVLEGDSIGVSRELIDVMQVACAWLEADLTHREL